MVLCVCAKVDNTYRSMAQQYFYLHPSIFNHIALVSSNNTILFFNSPIMRLLCTALHNHNSIKQYFDFPVFKGTTALIFHSGGFLGYDNVINKMQIFVSLECRDFHKILLLLFKVTIFFMYIILQSFHI